MKKFKLILTSIMCFMYMSLNAEAAVVTLDPVDGGDGYTPPEVVYTEPEPEPEPAPQVSQTTYQWDGRVLAPGIGTIYGPTGKETYYNMDMSTLVSWARSAGYSKKDYPYWVRDDGCKMLGPYIMCAANLDHFPRYSLVESSLGTCIVVDTGEFAYYAEGWNWLDIAVTW